MDEERIKQITDDFDEFYKNTREALELAGVPNDIIFPYLHKQENFKNLIPEDVVLFYKLMRSQIIVHLHSIGFTNREISRRLGGGSYHIVVDALKVYKEKHDTSNGKGTKSPSKHEV